MKKVTSHEPVGQLGWLLQHGASGLQAAEQATWPVLELAAAKSSKQPELGV